MPKTKNRIIRADNYKAAVKWPTSPYKSYLNSLDSYVNRLGEVVDDFWENRLRQTVGSMVQDAQQDQVDSQLDQLEERLTAVFGVLAMRGEAEQMAQQVRQRAIVAFQDDLQKVLGDQFAPVINYRNLEPFVKQTIRRNVSLIKSIPQQYHDDIERIIYSGIRTGKPVSAIQSQLDNALNVASGRTKTISMDQVGSLQGSLIRRMHVDVGLEKFRWFTMGDEKVRLTHVPRHGRVYSWSDPPGGEIPGGPPNCRCFASVLRAEVEEKFAQQGVGNLA